MVEPVSVTVLAMTTITTVVTFFQQLMGYMGPFFEKLSAKRKAKSTLPPIDPNCEIPRCGMDPYSCPDEKLTSACLERKMTFTTRATFSPSALTTKIEGKGGVNASTSLSSNTIIILAFVGVITLGIIVFLFTRCRNQNNHSRGSYDRKSSSWTV